MRHLLTWSDFSTNEILEILDVAAQLKFELRSGRRAAILQHRVIGLLFQKPSLRTRVSFESLAAQTGASSLFLGEDVGWGKREPASDFFPVLTSYLDCLVIRAQRHPHLVQAANLSRCPVINGLTDHAHPCQALADVLTMRELFGDLAGRKIAYIGDSNNVAFSLALLSRKIGIRFSIASPPGYQFDETHLERLNVSHPTNRDVEITTDPWQAVIDADVIYTDVWTSMGQESEREKRLQHFRDYQVNTALLAGAKDSVRFLHCLPARRGEEVSADIIDGPVSATIHQAENRLHAQKGLVVWLLRENREKR